MTGSSSTPPSPRRPRAWLVFFLVLLALASAAIIIPIVYNLHLQLDVAEVVRARQTWQEQGPPDYILQYQVKRDQDPRGDDYWVKVRSGQVVAAVQNGKPLLLDAVPALLLGLPVQAMPRASCQDLGVDGLLDQMQRLMERDRAEGTRNYATASFSSKDGHPTRFIYRVAGTRTRLEWNIRLRPLEPQAQAGER